MTGVAHGWYPDPDDPNARRYWDGANWSEPLRNEGAPPVADPSTPGSSSRRPGRLILIGAVVLAIAAALTWWFGFRSSTMTVRGTLTLNGTKDSGNYEVDPADSIGNTACHGVGGYSDISQGVTVTVSGTDGKTIGTGALEDGIYIDGSECIFGWQVTIPDDESSYGVTVSHRGTLQFSKAQMKAGADLTLGS